MNSGFLSNRRGVTLIEALVATFVMSLGLFVVGTAIYSQFSSLNRNREKAIATLAAQEEIESLRGMPFDSILALGTSFTASGFVYLNNPAGAIAVDTSTGFSHNGDSNIRKVSVTVTWDSINGGSSQRGMVTLITRGGINKQ